MHLFCDGLSSQCFTEARVPNKQHEKPKPLAFDDIIEMDITRYVCFHEREDQVFMTCWKHKLTESIIVP